MKMQITVIVPADEPSTDEELITAVWDDPNMVFEGAEWTIRRGDEEEEVKHG